MYYLPVLKVFGRLSLIVVFIALQLTSLAGGIGCTIPMGDSEAIASGASAVYGMAMAPATRSILIVFHGAEERGLLGSCYYAAHPVVPLSLKANDLTGKFTLDSTWDRPSHPEGWYFRSDHVPYARLGVPAVEYSTNLHPDYHTPRDTPANIDYAKLTRMTQWMYLTGWFVANAPTRPAIDQGFTLER